MQQRTHVRQQVHVAAGRSEGQLAKCQDVRWVHRKKLQACGSQQGLHAFARNVPRQCRTRVVLRVVTESALRTDSSGTLGIQQFDRTVAVPHRSIFAGSDQCLPKLACGQAWAGST
jgi:hypothetical protein